MASIRHFAALFGIIWLIRGATSHYSESTNGNGEQSVQSTDKNSTQEGDFYFQEQKTNEDNVLIGRTIHKTAWSEENDNQDESQSVNTKDDAKTTDEWNITNILKYILSLVYKYEETKEIPPDIDHEKAEKQAETTNDRQAKEAKFETRGNDIDKTSSGVPKNSEQNHQSKKPDTNYLNTFYQSEYIKWIDSEEEDEYSESSSDATEVEGDTFYLYEDSNFEKQEKTLPAASHIQDTDTFSENNDGENDHIKEKEDKYKFQCCKNKDKIYPKEKTIEQESPKSKEETIENNVKGIGYTKSSDNFHAEKNDENKVNSKQSNQPSKMEKCVKNKTKESQNNEYEKITVIPNKNQNDETNNFANDISSYTTESKPTNNHSNRSNENHSEINYLNSDQNPTSDIPKELHFSTGFYKVTPSTFGNTIPEETLKIKNDSKFENEDETQIKSPTTEESIKDNKNENQPTVSNEPVYKDDTNFFLEENNQQLQQTSIRPSENQNETNKSKANTPSIFEKSSSTSHMDDKEVSTAAPRNINDKNQSYNYSSYSDLFKADDLIPGDANTPSAKVNDAKPKGQPEYSQTSNIYYRSTVPYSSSENLNKADNLGHKSSSDFSYAQEEENEENEPEDSNNFAERNSNSRNQKKGVEYLEPHHGNANHKLRRGEEQNMSYGTSGGNNMQDETYDSGLHSPSPEEPDNEFQNQKTEMSNKTPEDAMVDKEDSIKKDDAQNTHNNQESNFGNEYYDYIKTSNEFIEVQQSPKKLTEHEVVKENNNNDETDSENMAIYSITSPSQLPQLTKKYKEQNKNENPNEFTETQTFSFNHVGGNEVNRDKDSGETDSKNTETFPQIFEQAENESESQEHFDTILEFLYKYSNNSFIQSLKNQPKDSL